MQSGNPLENFLAKSGQLILVAVLIAVLALMILPLSPALLDFLLALNIVGVMIILIVTISLSEPMHLSSFPTLLLISTLFRLGLNVSSTRMILSKGDAGQIIKTFGDYVTGGNLLVGLIIFLVLMIIQFIVVSKGSERVAEVAARFTLDALPGKQMSIDADLRAGTITSEQAALLRSELIRESKLYGAMDGAMKFVKGDTIAGFIITLINILGGFWIGYFQKGMSLENAARQYTILTIGDGLVAQIPALLVSLSAGIIVTRVTDRLKNRSLGGDIGIQILIRPAVLLFVAALTILIGCIPGFPTMLFFAISLSLISFALLLLWRVRKFHKLQKSIERHRVDASVKTKHIGQVTPFLLELAEGLYRKFLEDDRWQVCLNNLFPKLKSRLSDQLGVPFPDLKIAVNSDFPPEKYLIQVYEVPVEEGLLTPFYLELHEKTTIPIGHHKILAPEEMLLRHLAKTLKRHASDFVGIQEVRNILSNVEETHAELVREVVPRMLTVHKFTEILKRLVDESVPIKDFRLILEILSGANPEKKDAIDLTEIVRMGLRRMISYRYVGVDQKISCFGLDPEIEDEISQSIQKNGGDHYLAMSPDRMEKICQAIALNYQNHKVSFRDVVLLTSVEVRRYIRKIIENELPDVAVLSYQELDPRVKVDQRDTVSLYSANVMAI